MKVYFYIAERSLSYAKIVKRLYVTQNFFILIEEYNVF